MWLLAANDKRYKQEMQARPRARARDSDRVDPISAFGDHWKTRWMKTRANGKDGTKTMTRRLLPDQLPSTSLDAESTATNLTYDTVTTIVSTADLYDSSSKSDPKKNLQLHYRPQILRYQRISRRSEESNRYV